MEYSGASSAYTNGHLVDRVSRQGIRRDLDLSELLDLCSKPLGIDERVAELQRYSVLYPELKYFLVVAYFCKNAFSQLNAPGPVEYTPSKLSKGSSVETLKSLWKQVTLMYDTYPSGPKVKRGRAQQLLPELHKDDAALISDLLNGSFYRKELNELVVSKAFPNETPDTSKNV